MSFGGCRCRCLGGRHCRSLGVFEPGRGGPFSCRGRSHGIRRCRSLGVFGPGRGGPFSYRHGRLFRLGRLGFREFFHLFVAGSFFYSSFLCSCFFHRRFFCSCLFCSCLRGKSGGRPDAPRRHYKTQYYRDHILLHEFVLRLSRLYVYLITLPPYHTSTPFSTDGELPATGRGGSSEQ